MCLLHYQSANSNHLLHLVELFQLRHKIYSYSFLCVIWLITMCYYKPYNYVFQPNVLLQDFCRIKLPFRIYQPISNPFHFTYIYIVKLMVRERNRVCYKLIHAICFQMETAIYVYFFASWNVIDNILIISNYSFCVIVAIFKVFPF